MCEEGRRGEGEGGGKGREGVSEREKEGWMQGKSGI